MTIITASASFTRPADTTAYAANDLVANSTTAGSVSPMTFRFPTGYGSNFHVEQAKVRKSGTTATNANFHIRLYSASPTVANGDNGAWSSDGAATYLGKLDPAIMEAFTDGSANVSAFAAASDLHFNAPTDGVIYGLLVADAAYTPASAEVFTVELTVHIH